MAVQYEGIVRDGLPRQVAELIRAAIVEGRLVVDERLPTEEDLARRFGVSRPTVREALKVLAAQNLVRSRRGPAGGTFVVRPDPDTLARSITDAATLLVGMGVFDIEEIIAARAETEAVCCRLAAARRTEADLALMTAEVALQREPGLADVEFCASDVRFHRAIANATANGPLRLMMHAVIESYVPVTNMLIYRDQERRRTADAHEGIVAAIAAGDGKAAAALMRRHLEGLRSAIDTALARRAEGTMAKGTGTGPGRPEGGAGQ